MEKNYLFYPCTTMRITQSYTGSVSHLPHTTGAPADYPVDEGCSDTGRDYIYCPCSKMRLRRIYGVGSAGTNTLWLESTSRVYFADGTRDYCTLLITHPDDEDLRGLRQGQIFRKKEKICREGKDGATAYHFHISAGKGKIKGNGWTKNSKGKWVLTTTRGAFRPERLFYTDRAFTRIADSKGLTFIPLPYTKGKYRVKAEKLNVRKSPYITGERVGYEEFRKAGKRQLKNLMGKDYREDFFVKGMTLKISSIKGSWGKCPSGWVCLDYCEKL